MARKATQPVNHSRIITRSSIAADLAEFRKRGGRIEVLGTTAIRPFAATGFRSNPEQRKPPTPAPQPAKRSNAR